MFNGAFTSIYAIINGENTENGVTIRSALPRINCLFFSLIDAYLLLFILSEIDIKHLIKETFKLTPKFSDLQHHLMLRIKFSNFSFGRIRIIKCDYI